MAVDAEITRQHLRQELALVKELAATQHWDIVPDYVRLTILATMYAHTGDLFILDVQCDDYKELPPFFEFVDPNTGERGTRHAYPKGNDGFFNETGPCICAPFNRKAYKSSDRPSALHGDWALGDWQTSTASRIRWANYSKLGDMLGLIYTRLSRPDLYRGRMQ